MKSKNQFDFQSKNHNKFVMYIVISYRSCDRYSANTNGKGTWTHVRKKPITPVTIAIPSKSHSSKNTETEFHNKLNIYSKQTEIQLTKSGKHCENDTSQIYISCFDLYKKTH